MKILKKALPHSVATMLFIAIAVAFFYPVLQGKAIFQSDIAQYIGMAKERNDYRETENKESYWTNSAFGGMPTYQLGAQYPNDMIKQIDKTIRFLPRPADYLFLYFVGFYILLLVLKADYKTAFLGAVAFGFSTYLIIILGVGHNAKAHAIAYFAPLLAGIILVFRKKYLWGGLLAAFATALEINANHYQMTYYLLLLIGLLCLFEGYKAIKNEKITPYFKSVTVLAFAAFIGVLANATPLLATKEYSDWSTRGTSELTIAPDGSPKKQTGGLSKNYITEYSYGIAESLNLIVPRLFGGSNNETLGESSNTYQFLIKNGVTHQQAIGFAEGLPTYWGKQPIVAAPAYVGAVVFFLFVLALFLVKGSTKWWLLAGTIMALLLSWGKNFSFLTDFMIDYFPMYNKFRAVSSIQVILELCVPLLAMLGLVRFFKNSNQENKKPFQYTLYITLGIMLLLFLGKGFFSFAGVSDMMYQQYYGKEVLAMIIEDRKSIYTSDVLRSTVFILLTTLTLLLFRYKKLGKISIYVILLILIGIDLGGVANRYVNSEDFVSSRIINDPFQATQIDKMIMQDTTIFRVYEPSVGINGARTSYFHHSIGGYHAAKPKRLQELFDYQLANGNREVLNMLNVKYFLIKDEQGQEKPMLNSEALGNAWFVKTLISQPSEDDVMKALSDFNAKDEALIVSKSIENKKIPASFVVDSMAQIRLKTYKPDELIYETENSNDGFAVFSEAYYANGWKATIDGQPSEICKVDYMLRGLFIPKGKHEIIFRFEPQVVETGSKITLAGNILLAFWLLGGLFYQFTSKKNRREE